MQPVNTPEPKVVVEYDTAGGRKRVVFVTSRAARSFYLRCLRLGKNPKVKKPEEGE